MAVFFLLLAILLTVGVIVFFLRRQQDRATAEYADRHQPLPPLQPPELEPEEPEQETQEPETLETGAPESAADPDSEEPPGESQHPGHVNAAPEASSPAPPRDWLKQCQNLRNEGLLDQAMALSKQASPQLQGFEQQALILRARLREARQQSDEVATRRWLDALYLVAARASCLHDGPSPQRPDSPRRMVDVIDSARLEQMEMPYTEIGHEKLKLLRKTDRQLLESFYGQPLRHISAREWHGL